MSPSVRPRLHQHPFCLSRPSYFRTRQVAHLNVLSQLLVQIAFLTCDPQLPFWALVSFGAFLLFRLGWNVMTFNDVPEAHKELMAEIEMAKQDLRGLGVDVD